MSERPERISVDIGKQKSIAIVVSRF